MRDLAILFLHLVATLIRLAGPGGARVVVAESVLIKQQLPMMRRENWSMTTSDSAWMSQVSRKVTDATDGFLRGKRFLIHDRDPRFTVAFGETLAGAGVQVLLIPRISTRMRNDSYGLLRNPASIG